MKREQARCWLCRLGIQQKIAWGYGLSLGVAIVGTGVGIVWADLQQRQAETVVIDALEELDMISNLQVSVLQTLADQRQLSDLLSQSQSNQRQDQYAEWQEHYHQFRQHWEMFQTTQGGTTGNEDHEYEGEVTAVTTFLEKYEGIPEAYIQTLDRLYTRINPATLPPTEIPRIEADLIQFEQSVLVDQIDTFAAEVGTLNAIIHAEYDAAQTRISASNTLRLQVIGLSMAVSVAIAVLCSILISRAIARPIQSLTQVIQQALDESNFDLQVGISTEDEIGTLALSFKQLISSVKHLLDEQHNKTVQLQHLLEQLHHSQLQMIQSEKMSSLGQLVAGVAHEINNPVNFIYGNLTHAQDYTHNLLKLIQLYHTQFPNPGSEIEREIQEIDLEFLQDDLPKLLNSMEIGTDRIRQIVLSLRKFSRMDEAEFKAVDIHEGIDSTLLILRHRLKAKSERPGIEVIRDYGILPLVECYSGQINQVFMNILTNAIDAIEEHNASRPASAIQDSTYRITIRTFIEQSQWLILEITDNGIGIPESVQPKIFNPFFTTKPVGKGTGMGMAISYQIITERHGGTITCVSSPETGTTFTIRIPVKQPPRKVVSWS